MDLDQEIDEAVTAAEHRDPRLAPTDVIVRRPLTEMDRSKLRAAWTDALNRPSGQVIALREDDRDGYRAQPCIPAIAGVRLMAVAAILFALVIVLVVCLHG